jgi:hypothetical protein
MKRMSIMVLALAALFTIGALSASAAPVGTRATVSADLAAYFNTNGVDAKYLNVAPSTIPADVMGKINDILTRTDNTVSGNLYHTDLVNLIGSNLRQAVTAEYAPVYLEFGNVVYEAEQGISPSILTAAQLAATPAAEAYVQLN